MSIVKKTRLKGGEGISVGDKKSLFLLMKKNCSFAIKVCSLLEDGVYGVNANFEERLSKKIIQFN